MVAEGRHYKLGLDEVEQIGRAVGPTIREEIRQDLREQTGDFRNIIDTHQKSVANLISEHEKNDNDNFGRIERRQRHTEMKLQYFAGGVAVLVVLIPILWDLAKMRFGIGK